MPATLAHQRSIGYTDRKPLNELPMSDTLDIAEPEPPRVEPDALRGPDEHLNPLWVERLRARLDAGDATEVADLVAPLHAADMGDLLEAIGAEERVKLVTLLGDKFDFSALTEVDDSVRSDLIEELPSADVARGVAELDNDDAVYILEDIDVPARDDILAQMPAFERLKLKRSLDFPEDSAGRLMQTDFIAIPPFWTVGQTIDYMRSEQDLPDDFYQIYVVTAAYTLEGIVALDKFLRARRDVRIADVMQADPIEIDASEDQERAARTFERYDLVEVAVVDETKRLVGVLTIDDIVDVIHEEATEDIQRLAGVGDEDISDDVRTTLRSRLTWLFVNLLTAILASSVIDIFDGTISKMVALAVLMPIVASMGGNAGTQTMTVTVRALATQELDRYKLTRLVWREILVGIANGWFFALIMGVVATIWFQNWGLGVVMALALVVNLFAAALAGVLIPLGLNRLRIDPAIASSAFVTTVTDVVGFYSFLLFAGLWFHLF
jgi:magnesium transporter